MPVDVKVMAAQELARLAWDKTQTIEYRLTAARALQRQVDKLIASLEND